MITKEHKPKCSDCPAELYITPDTNHIRMLWICTNFFCMKYGISQKQMWMKDYLENKND